MTVVGLFSRVHIIRERPVTRPLDLVDCVIWDGIIPLVTMGNSRLLRMTRNLYCVRGNGCMRTTPALVLVALIVTGGLALSQTMSAPRSESFPPFALTEGQKDADGFPTSGAKLCVTETSDQCFQMPEYTAHEYGNMNYEFGLDPRTELLLLTGGGSWVLFSAVFSAGGSGSLTRLAVLRYEGEGGTGRIVNLLPLVGVTNASEFAMWTIPGASTYPALIDADFVWGNGETHFGRHFYTVEAWRFDPKADRYVKAFSYRTSRKYGGGDSGPIRVLGPERAEILRRFETR
jgi:hypothetical protein